MFLFLVGNLDNVKNVMGRFIQSKTEGTEELDMGRDKFDLWIIVKNKIPTYSKKNEKYTQSSEIKDCQVDEFKYLEIILTDKNKMI